MCRPGYRCYRGDADAGYRNGGCLPIDCVSQVARCPEGSSCVRSDGDGGVLFTGSRCVRGSGSPDGSAPVTDASADGATPGAHGAAAGRGPRAAPSTIYTRPPLRQSDTPRAACQHDMRQS